MSDLAEYDNANLEVNDGVAQEVHCIKDIDSATDFELKHTPCIEVANQEAGRLVKVSIGLKNIAHPQTEEHLIEWIRVFVGGELASDVHFGPTDKPELELVVDNSDAQIVAQALCNLHGLWEARA
ncbi:MAG: class II SORL domain-containing protein [Coriobacteriales bacterium]|jgi:desulfoferrodoxin-like iron-binding protein|nr:class II SORL domain-containing protein [Coriobacteriales bacterium]